MSLSSAPAWCCAPRCSGAGIPRASTNDKPVSDPQERNLDWFPRMRAMSLVSSDSEGEQNELRNLQEKLESTMKLVTNLSGQLSELKDQVRETRKRACRHTHTWAAQSSCTPLLSAAFRSSKHSVSSVQHFSEVFRKAVNKKTTLPRPIPQHTCLAVLRGAA